MQLTKRKFFRRPDSSLLLFISILFFYSQPVFSQRAIKDTCNKIELASIHEKKSREYVVKESNVVFPDILKGNEDEAIDYIQNFSSKRKEYVIRMYKKGRILLPKAAAILKRHNLPQELKVLLPLESAYNPTAKSRAGAVGYWQIMDEVAREYGMKCAQREIKTVKHFSKHRASKKIKVRQRDDRMNFNKATITAARYLHARRLNLNDNWLLVVASYNCGVGNVWSAMKRTGKTNPDFWDIKKYLPAETRAYVMNFIAMNVIFSNYDNFIKNNLVFKPVKLKLNNVDEDFPEEIFSSDFK